ncbi:hypothetical protein BsWGS_25843 [Bradybaena similaris]
MTLEMNADIRAVADTNFNADIHCMTDSRMNTDIHAVTADKFAPPNKSLPDVKIRNKGPHWWRSQRYILAYFLFGATMNVFFQRINFNIAIICMVNHTAISYHENVHNYSSNFFNNSHNFITKENTSFHNTTANNSENDSDSQQYDSLVFHNSGNNLSIQNYSVDLNNMNSVTDVNNFVLANDILLTTTPTSSDLVAISSAGTSPVSGYNSETDGSEQPSDRHTSEDGPLVWHKETQGMLLAAMYWTYTVTSIPANLVVRKLKKKTILVCSMTLMSVMTMLMHMAALWSPWAVFAVKLVQGSCTALAIIAIYGMWGKWAPPKERAGLITLAMSGQNLGNIIVFPVSGLLCKHGFLGGWPSIFYVFGGLGFVWIVLFFLFTDESPSTHRFITQQEKEYIMSALTHTPHTRQSKVPWGAMLTSLPFWGIVIGQFSFTWGLLLILSTLPQYMYEVLKFDIKSNGILTMLPYIALLFVTQAAGAITDAVIRRKLLGVLWTRRLCVLIANLVPAVLLAALSFLDHTQAGLAISLLVSAVGISGFALSGFLVSPYDIGPRFATEMMIIINTAATIPGIVANYFVAAVTKDQTREQWQVVYFLTSGIYVLGAVCFCLLGRGDVQPWARETLSLFVSVNESPTDVGQAADKEKELMLNKC